MSSIPLVALNAKTPEQPDLADQFGKLMQLKNMQTAMQQQQAEAPLRQQALQQQVQAGQLQNQQAQQAQQEHDAAMKIIQESNGDIRTALPKLMQVSPTAAIKWQQDLMTSDQTAIKTKQEIIKYHQDQTGRIAQLAGSVTDPQSYEAAIQQAASESLIDPQTAQAMIQKGYDPNTVKGLQTQALTAQQQLDAAQKQLQDQETARHNKAMETKPSAAMESMNDFLKAKEAAKGSPLTAQEGMAARQEYFQRNKSQTSVFGSASPSDAKETAQMIQQGQAVPVLTEYSFRDRTTIAAELHRMGYNQAQAEQDWKATQKYLNSLNGAQQMRLRQAISFTSETIPQIQQAFDAWKATGLPGGFQAYNGAALKAAENLPGKAGSAAHNLRALIADFTSELGTVYKGGNSSTDESLKLAAQNLGANWNEQTFTDALKRIDQSLKIRKNSINVGVSGASNNSPYPAGVGGADNSGSDQFSQFGGKAH